LASNIALFADVFKRIPKLNSVIEFGANIGLNLRALDLLHPGQEQVAVEINESAAKKINDTLPNAKVFNLAISDFDSGMLRNGPCDLALIKGVLIHINPDQLKMVYKKLYESTKKFILICEYYNPKPDTVTYRGHSDKLFRRDFAGEMLDIYSDLKLVNYGFAYHRDPSFPQDDTTWFLLEKS
jgi:spore coat polysaccharide biosynthesis protein SpsF